MKKVMVLTTFTGWDSTYSLCIVAAEQIRMLVANGYKPVVVVKQGFRAEDVFALPEVELRYIPVVPCSNYINESVDATFKDDVEKLKNAMVENLKDIDVVFTHDLIYQPESLKLNFACRKAIEEDDHLKKVRWLHWIHSATSPYTLGKELSQGDTYFDIISQKFPNSFVVFPNSYSIPRVARNFGYEEDEVKVVHHSTNLPGYCQWDGLVTQLVMEKNMLSADAIAVYPIRLDRGKKVEVVIKIMAQLKKLGYIVRVIIIDFHSTGGDKVTYREELKKTAIDWGLNDYDMTFTSEYHESWKVNVPRKVVHDLFELSNVFIMPSQSETYSLITQEAALCGNILMLNHDFAPFRDIYGKDAIYKQFSSNIGFDGLDGDITTTYSDEKGYFHDCAMRLKYELDNNMVLAMQKKLRKERNPMTVFKNEMEPLLYAETKDK
jgi:glycosyltransferase involved in cell wall biosynthesis